MNPKKQSQRTISFNPATGEKIGTSPMNSRADVQSAIKRARRAQKEWGGLTVHERVRCIKPIRDYLIEHIDHIAQTIAMDNGKTRIDALATEVIPAIMAVDYYCKNAKNFLKDKKIRTGNIALSFKHSKLVRVPFGVVGIITPWNYPFSIPLSEVIMGLLAGNAVIVKTATETQMVGRTLEASIKSADLPKHLFSFINMPGRIAGDVFLESGVDKLFFTGSVDAGKYLMKKASRTLTPVCLELGGNDAMLVCEDADLERAAAGAVWAGFSNAGQSCAGVERIYVHKDVYHQFLEILKRKTEALAVGYDRSYEIDMGCMTIDRQMKKVKEHVAEAVAKGAKISAQSQLPKDTRLKNFLPAMVLTDVNHTMKVMKEETLGPVIGVMSVKDMDTAVALANDSLLGLNGSVWSKKRKKAALIARKIQAGTVTINDHLMSHGLAETSWGGFKESGIGRTHGRLGFDEMTEPQFIVDDILSFSKKNLWWHPFTKKMYEGLRGMAEMLYAKDLMKRLGGLINMAKILPRMFKAE